MFYENASRTFQHAGRLSKRISELSISGPWTPEENAEDLAEALEWRAVAASVLYSGIPRETLDRDARRRVFRAAEMLPVRRFR
jgi:hypothetical protein